MACEACDLLVGVGALQGGQRAHCPRCGHLLTACVEDGLSRSLAYAIAAAVFLLAANTFPFIQLSAQGLEQVMTLPRTAIEFYRDGHAILAVIVLGPIVGIPALMLVTKMALLTTLLRRRRAGWLVPAARFLFMLGPWSMAEVFVIGVLVSLVKIASMATVVIGLSFWAYVGFAICFTASIASLDRLQLWREIEACSA